MQLYTKSSFRNGENNNNRNKKSMNRGKMLFSGVIQMASRLTRSTFQSDADFVLAPRSHAHDNNEQYDGRNRSKYAQQDTLVLTRLRLKNANQQSIM